MKISNSLKFLTYIILILIVTGCLHPKKLVPGEGYINVDGGKVWYRIIGEGSATPILLLHGGPGVPSYYIKPLEALRKNRQVILIYNR